MNNYIKALENKNIDEINKYGDRLFKDLDITTYDEHMRYNFAIVNAYNNLMNNDDPTLYQINDFIQQMNFYLQPAYHLEYDPMLGELTNPKNGQTLAVTPLGAKLEIKYVLNY